MNFPDVPIIINLVSFAVITGIVKTTITLSFNITYRDLMFIITSKILVGLEQQFPLPLLNR